MPRSLGSRYVGELLDHLLFEFVLSFSGWTWARLAYSETFEALSLGLQGALWELGGCPEVARSDNLSAATHELRLTRGSRAHAAVPGPSGPLRDALDTDPAWGVPRERGGGAEAPPDEEPSRPEAGDPGEQGLRGRRAYEAFVDEVVDESNRLRKDRLSVEREHLLPLPSARVPAHTTFHPRVSCWSTARVGGRIYSVPSRLIGHEVEVRQHPDEVELLYAGKLVETMPRIRGDKPARIDYRHVIWSLLRKPGAFARYRYREELFPSLTFRRAYDALRAREVSGRTWSTSGSCTWPRARWSRRWSRRSPSCSRPAMRSTT